MESTLNDLAIKQALLQTKSSTKQKAKSAEQAAATNNLHTLVGALSKQTTVQIKDSKAQNKPLNAATERAKVLNALDEKAKNLVS